MSKHATIADAVSANKWDDDPTTIYIDTDSENPWSDGFSIDCTPEQALELARAIEAKALLALAGKYDRHFEGELGEEIP